MPAMILQRLRALWHGHPGARDEREALVAELYRGILGREPDPSGLRSHAATLHAGLPLGRVARSMIESDEFNQSQKYLRVPAVTLPDLTQQSRWRYQRNADGSTTLEISDDAQFDELEHAILEHRYYDSFGVWSPVIDLDKRITAALAAGLGAKRCLEIGCFTGPVLSLLQERGIDVTGVEISHLAFVLAYPSIRNHLRYGDLLSVELAGPFDVLLAMDILEHLNPLRLDRYLERLHDLLDRDGYALVNSPMFGHDEVFGATDIPLPQWRQAGPDAHWRHLHCDALGWPLHGHLIWASPTWWQRQFESHGLVRDHEIERRIHACLGGFFDQYAPARRTFFVLKHRANARGSHEVAERITAELSTALAGHADLSNAMEPAPAPA